MISTRDHAFAVQERRFRAGKRLIAKAVWRYMKRFDDYELKKLLRFRNVDPASKQDKSELTTECTNS